MMVLMRAPVAIAESRPRFRFYWYPADGSRRCPPSKAATPLKPKREAAVEELVAVFRMIEEAYVNRVHALPADTTGVVHA